jgi:hypothetical protein
MMHVFSWCNKTYLLFFNDLSLPFDHTGTVKSHEIKKLERRKSCKIDKR